MSIITNEFIIIIFCSVFIRGELYYLWKCVDRGKELINSKEELVSSSFINMMTGPTVELINYSRVNNDRRNYNHHFITRGVRGEGFRSMLPCCVLLFVFFFSRYYRIGFPVFLTLVVGGFSVWLVACMDKYCKYCCFEKWIGNRFFFCIFEIFISLCNDSNQYLKVYWYYWRYEVYFQSFLLENSYYCSVRSSVKVARVMIGIFFRIFENWY